MRHGPHVTFEMAEVAADIPGILALIAGYGRHPHRMKTTMLVSGMTIDGRCAP